MNVSVILHFVFMFTSLVLIIIAISIVRKKANDDWLNKHRMFAVCGALSALAGAVIMFIHKSNMGYPHFKSPHAIAGPIVVLLLLITPSLGFLLTKGKESLRPVHKTMGKITGVLIILNVFFGIIRILQLNKIIKFKSSQTIFPNILS